MPSRRAVLNVRSPTAEKITTAAYIVTTDAVPTALCMTTI
jgi:hypothetical protein